MKCNIFISIMVLLLFSQHAYSLVSKLDYDIVIKTYKDSFGQLKLNFFDDSNKKLDEINFRPQNFKAGINNTFHGNKKLTISAKDLLKSKVALEYYGKEKSLLFVDFISYSLKFNSKGVSSTNNGVVNKKAIFKPKDKIFIYRIIKNL